MNKEDITRIMFQFVLVWRGYIYLPAERVAAAQEELAEVGMESCFHTSHRAVPGSSAYRWIG